MNRWLNGKMDFNGRSLFHVWELDPPHDQEGGPVHTEAAKVCPSTSGEEYGDRLMQCWNAMCGYPYPRGVGDALRQLATAGAVFSPWAWQPDDTGNIPINPVLFATLKALLEELSACLQSHLDCPRCAEKNKQIRELEAHLQTENDRHVQDHTRAEELTKQLAQAQRSADKWRQAFLKLYAECDAVA